MRSVAAELKFKQKDYFVGYDETGNEFHKCSGEIFWHVGDLSCCSSSFDLLIYEKTECTILENSRC